jgi:predicted ArsR family transcriptional regulator
VIDLPSAADPGDVLSQPTRARLFGLLSELRRPAGTAELAERVALHPNGVRLHMERLVEAGLVERARAHTQRGRPPDTWQIAPGAQPAGEKPRAYRDLGRWLARALAARPSGPRGIEAIGRQIGRELAPTRADATAAEALGTTLTALGFQPSVERQAGGTAVRCCLGNCPYSEAVRENQPAVCALHKGITRGLLDVFEPRATLTAFEPRNPDEAGCVIEFGVYRSPRARGM